MIDRDTRTDSSIGRRATVLVTAGVLALTGCNKVDGDNPSPDGEDPVHVTWLAENLAKGICRNTIALWNNSEANQTAARAYVESNGQPTAACPSPETDIQVICDPDITTGDELHGSTVIRYHYSAGGSCVQPGTTSV